MHRPLYLLGFGYLAICGAVVLRHRAGPLIAPAHGSVTPSFGGSAGEWFAAIKPYCNAVEVDLVQRQHPAPSTLEGRGLSAACYALGGKIDLARGVIDRLAAPDRYQAAGIGFNVAHPVADAGDDRSSGPIMELARSPAAARLARERLRREVQAVRQLSHPNIVAVYDVVDDGPWSFVVMEYVPGPDLAVRVRQRGPLDADAAVRLARDVTAALAAAHRHGILHRDVKPQNILLAPDGRARLTDFGSARLAGQETVTQTGGLVGTADYAAPEQLAGGRGDARADEYALGVTLYYALTGELPARAPVRGADAGRDGHRPRRRRPEVPGWLDDVVGRSTMPDPDDRFPAIALVAEALERGEDGVDRRAGAPPPASAAKARCVLCPTPQAFRIGG